MPDPLTLHPHELRRLEERGSVLLLRPVEPPPHPDIAEFCDLSAFSRPGSGAWKPAWGDTTADVVVHNAVRFCPFGVPGDPLPVDGMPLIQGVRVLRLSELTDAEMAAAGVRSYIYPACGDHPDMQGWVTDADGEFGAAHQTRQGALAKLLQSLYPEMPSTGWWWAVTVERGSE